MADASLNRGRFRASLQLCALRFVLVALLVVLPAPAPAHGAQLAPPRTIHDITALLDQYKPDAAKIDALKAAVKQEPPATDDRIALAQFYAKRAGAAEELGMVEQQIADLRRAAEYAKGWADGEWDIVIDLAFAEIFAGNFLNGLKLYQQSLALVRGARGREISANAVIAAMYGYMGDVGEARKALRDAEVVMYQLRGGRGWATYGDIWTALVELARGSVARAEGKYAGAETAFRRALDAHEKWLEVASQTFASGAGVASPERAARGRDSAERRLAETLLLEGRLAEAEVTIRNVLQSNLKRLGRYANITGVTTTRLAEILNEQGRYREGAVLAHAALDIFDKTGTAANAVYYNLARRMLGTALAAQGRWDDALEIYEKARGNVGGDVDTLLRFGVLDTTWPLAMVKTGRAAEALPMLEALLKATRERLGETHYQVAEQRGFLALALAEVGQRQRALAEYQGAIKTLLARSRVDADEESDSPARAWRRALILEGYIRLLYDMRGEIGQRAGLDPAAEAFRVADAVRGQSTQRALAASAARAAAGTPALAEIVRREQDTKQQIATLYGLLTRMLSAPPDQQLPQVTAQMRARIQELEKERRTLFSDLEKRFPAYVDLINPKPATTDETRTALRAGEALLSVLVTDDRTYVWAVPKDGPVAYHAANLGVKEINRIVAHLRAALDAGDVSLARLPAFDVAAAYRLYEQLLAPVEASWKDARTLIVVANGALGQLPFSLLPTASPKIDPDQRERFGHYKSVPWLVRQAAVTQLPAANTLVTLRALPPGNRERAPFIGFGDPQFGRQPVTVAGRDVIMRMRNLAIPRVTEEQAAVDWISYSQLAPLPDTREEILAIAAALKANPVTDVFLGRQASKQNVEKLDLSKRRIIAFATHGLIPGDFPNLDQPALALSATGDDPETGLLKLEDILKLKLDADWVVLSACNTAAGDGAGAEAISGLARGFFYAGSKALLVTHWPVETRSARALVSEVFVRYASQPGVTRAEALRQASLALLDGPGYVDPATGKPLYSYAHPVFWAPYALVGDGGR